MHDGQLDGRGDELIAAVARELRAGPVGDGAAVKARITAEVLRLGVPAGNGASPPRTRRGWGARGLLVGAWSWLSSPRPVRISPLGGLATTAAVALLAWAVAARDAAPPGSPQPARHYAEEHSPTDPLSLRADSPRSAAALPAAGAGAWRGSLSLTAAGHSATSTGAAGSDSPRVVQFVLVAPTAHRVSLVGDFNGWDVGSTPLHRISGGQRDDMWVVEIQLAPGRHAYAFVVDDSTWMADPRAARAPGNDFGAPSSVIVVGAGAT
jgi:hypothetical protein